MIENPFVLGAVVVILTWCIKTFGWAKDGWQSIVATMLMSLGIAVVEAALGGKLLQFTLEEAYQFIANILLASQIIYQAIRRGLDAYREVRARLARA